MLDWLRHPWPWYVSGPLIGLMVPMLLLLGNKSFGVSSSLRHICAICFPSKIPFFQYQWKKEAWNLFFVAGITGGAFLAAHFLPDPGPVHVNPKLVHELSQFGVINFNNLMPADLFNWNSLLTVRGIIMIVVGGFLVGFGTRYAGGCTSGHSIMGISNLQMSSVIATICFMIGGLIMTNFILPYILQL
ncbi:MAG: YeeE/YedE family protein [Bacteroidetes bacterium]|nr:YeeE/YedE family protein [Bacteroidota bacterium]MBS1932270.1 YeeE/YedE family protein [Bacteroidota bacterium]